MFRFRMISLCGSVAAGKGGANINRFSYYIAEHLRLYSGFHSFFFLAS